jgi:aromatic ring-opening dioxygenase catalytic subunit (LigB family)
MEDYVSRSRRMPTLFVPHGGGPCFFMDGPPPFNKAVWATMAHFLESVGGTVARPEAILVISGHWQTATPTINTAQRHKLYFDYYGFPEHTYRLTYPAAGSPTVAHRVRELLAGAGIPTESDPERGLDHGVFVPFKLIYPHADIPIVQLSLRDDMDPAAHLAMGRALEPLRDEGVLIVGSGMSYHNMQGFGRGAEADREAATFDAWLSEAVAEPGRREAALTAWLGAPCALACHPEAEHLIPLHVVAGAAGGDAGRCVYKGKIGGKTISAFQFG